jgi:ribose transport system permease protein
LQNLVNLLGIPSSLNFAVMGGVILVGVVGDQVLQRRAARVRDPQPSRELADGSSLGRPGPMAG